MFRIQMKTAIVFNQKNFKRFFFRDIELSEFFFCWNFVKIDFAINSMIISKSIKNRRT